MKWDKINEDWKSVNSLFKWSFRCPCRRGCFKVMLRYGKTGNKKRATCPAPLLKNELNSDVVRFTTYIKPVLQQIRLLTGLNVGGKTRNTTTQLVLQQYCKTSCAFFSPRRLQAVSLFSVVRRAKRETRKWPRAWLMAREALTKPEEKERLLAVYRAFSFCVLFSDRGPRGTWPFVFS